MLKSGYNDPSKCKCWKLYWATLIPELHGRKPSKHEAWKNIAKSTLLWIVQPCEPPLQNELAWRLENEQAFITGRANWVLRGRKVFFCPLELVPIHFNSRLVCALTNMAATWQKKSRLDRATYCLFWTRQNLKPGYFDRRHLGETTLDTTALDPQSEDYESNTNKQTDNRNPSHPCFIDTSTNWSLTAK